MTGLGEAIESRLHALPSGAGDPDELQAIGRRIRKALKTGVKFEPDCRVWLAFSAIKIAGPCLKKPQIQLESVRRSIPQKLALQKGINQLRWQAAL